MHINICPAVQRATSFDFLPSFSLAGHALISAHASTTHDHVPLRGASA
jgi:hypothetical protein